MAPRSDHALDRRSCYWHSPQARLVDHHRRGNEAVAGTATDNATELALDRLRQLSQARELTSIAMYYVLNGPKNSVHFLQEASRIIATIKSDIEARGE